MNINGSPDNKITALHIVVGDEDLIKTSILLKHNADPNVKDINNSTPLHYACLTGNTNIIKVLLEHGVGINSKNLSDDTALSLAISNNNFEAVNILLKKPNLEINQTDVALIINHKVQKILEEKR